MLIPSHCLWCKASVDLGHGLAVQRRTWRGLPQLTHSPDLWKSASFIFSEIGLGWDKVTTPGMSWTSRQVRAVGQEIIWISTFFLLFCSLLLCLVYIRITWGAFKTHWDLSPTSNQVNQYPWGVCSMGFSSGASGKEPKAGDIRDMGLIPGSRRSPGGGHGNPLQYSCLNNPMDRGVWQATVYGAPKSQTWLKWLSMQGCDWHPWTAKALQMILMFY